MQLQIKRRREKGVERTVTIVPRTRVGRVVATIAALVMLPFALLFFTVFLAAGIVLASLFIARVLWMLRSVRQPVREDVIDTTCSVEETEALSDTAKPSSQRPIVLTHTRTENAPTYEDQDLKRRESNPRRDGP